MKEIIQNKSPIMSILIAVFLLIVALPAKADWCRIPVTGLSYNLIKGDHVYLKTYSDIAETYVTIQGVGSYVLRGNSFELLEKPARYPDSGKPYKLFTDTTKTNDGRVFLSKRVKARNGHNRHMFVSQSNGTMKLLFETSHPHLSVDKETARIFSIKDTSLYEWNGNSFQLSSIGLDADDKQKPFAWDLSYHPSYFPQLKSWAVVNNGKLWLRSDKTETWRKINNLKRWRTHSFGTSFEVFHDHDRQLVALSADMSVSVFDVSGAEPKFLYQRLIRRGAISQAGNSGILIEPIKPYKDVWFWENTSITRLITHDGARAIPGVTIKDNRGLRRSLFEGSKVNWMRVVGDSVLVFHQGGVALFDGSSLHDRPDIHAIYPKSPPLAYQTDFGTFLTTLYQIHHWDTSEKVKPLLIPNMKNRIDITVGHNLLLVRSRNKEKTKAWVYDESHIISQLPLVEEIDEFDGLVPIANRQAILAYSHQEFFILEKCRMDGK